MTVDFFYQSISNIPQDEFKTGHLLSKILWLFRCLLVMCFVCQLHIDVFLFFYVMTRWISELNSFYTTSSRKKKTWTAKKNTGNLSCTYLCIFLKMGTFTTGFMSKQFATEGTAQLLSKQGIRGDLTCEPWSFRNGCPIKKIDNISHLFWEMHIFFRRNTAHQRGRISCWKCYQMLVTAHYLRSAYMRVYGKTSTENQYTV